MISMYSIRQPNCIVFGKNTAKDYQFPNDCILITSKGARKRGWIDYINLKKFSIFDNVEPNPSMLTINKIINEFSDKKISCVIGLGGGSSLDVAKFVAKKINKPKILIPTTFGSGSEVTRISVLKINGKKKSFHDDQLLADIAIIDENFIQNSPEDIIKNSAIDACAQCTEAFDSKNSNYYTKFFCEKAFDLLEDAILNSEYRKLPLGALYAGLGFGSASTTLGHALSYVFSNEGISHGHALAFSTTVSHKFNTSNFYERFKKIVRKLDFEAISLNQNYGDAAEIILNDKKHLDNNPIPISKTDIINLLKIINEKRVFD